MLYPTETDDDEGASLIEVGEEASGEAGGESDGEAKKKEEIVDITEEKAENNEDLLDEEVESFTFSSSSLILILE